MTGWPTILTDAERVVSGLRDLARQSDDQATRAAADDAAAWLDRLRAMAPAEQVERASGGPINAPRQMEIWA